MTKKSEQTASPARNFTLTTAERVQAIVQGVPAWSRRLKRIEDLTAEIIQLHIAGREFPPGQEPAANFLGVSPTYFETMRIPIVRGRALTANDRAGAPPVVVINEELAHRLWPNESPLGKRFYCCGDDSVHVWREIVGVSRNVRHWLTARPFDEIYVPYEQAPAASWVWFSNTVTLVMRTERSDAILPMRLRTAIAAVDPSLPLFEQFSYDDLWRRST